MTTLPLAIRPEHPDDGPAIDRLHRRAFGPGRFARTAYRLREGAEAVPDLCFAALVGTYLVGSVRIGPIEANGHPLLVLGPLTVDPSFSDRGIGTALMKTGLDAARAAGHRAVILVGDASYYARFGFAAISPGRLALPGPVDPARFLWLALTEDGFEGLAGTVRACQPGASPKSDPIGTIRVVPT